MLKENKKQMANELMHDIVNNMIDDYEMLSAQKFLDKYGDLEDRT